MAKLDVNGSGGGTTKVTPSNEYKPLEMPNPENYDMGAKVGLDGDFGPGFRLAKDYGKIGGCEFYVQIGDARENKLNVFQNTKDGVKEKGIIFIASKVDYDIVCRLITKTARKGMDRFITPGERDWFNNILRAAARNPHARHAQNTARTA